MYQKTHDNNAIIRQVDAARIPIDTNNSDYLEYLKWKADGGVPVDADQLTVREQVKAQLFSEYGQAEISLAMIEKENGDATAFDAIKARAIEIKNEVTA
jgi:hypothetical protein